MGRLIDLTGRRFGKLVVLGRDYSREYHRPFWKCICDCGNETIVKGSSLVCGSTKSCGCLKHQVIHGDAVGGHRSRLNSIYHSMISRCYIASTHSYKNYGGRGIEVCSEWRNNYQEFKRWALSNGYADDLSLDRIDVNDDYNPNNCRWVTWEEQCNNKRHHILIPFNGKTQTAAQWSRELKMPYQTIVERYKRGITAEEIFARG